MKNSEKFIYYKTLTDEILLVLGVCGSKPWEEDPIGDGETHYLQVARERNNQV